MTASLPFGRSAKGWERSARRLRQRQNLKLLDRLDPWAIAQTVGLCVLDGDDAHEAINALPFADRGRIQLASGSWSGGVLPEPSLPDGSLLCILNPNHHVHRRKVTLMEEVSHVFLQHKPSGLEQVTAGLRSRTFDKEMEQEAYGVGAAAILPWEPLLEMVNDGLAIRDIASDYIVSEQFVDYRIKRTGLWPIYKERQDRSA